MSGRQDQLRPNALGVSGIVFLVVAAVGPMAAVLGATPLVFAANGAGTAGTYALGAIMFAIFAVGYVAMSRYIGNAGGFVTYIAQGLSKGAGAAASYVALLTYAVLLCSIYGIYAVFAKQTATDKLGLNLPWQAWALGTLVVVGALAYNKVEVSARVLGVLLLAEVVVVLVLDTAIIAQGGDGGNAGLTFSGFGPSTIFSGDFGLAFLFALISFGGFEATVVFSEEAKDRRRTIPRATYIAVAFLGIFYALTTWALTNAVGPTNIQKVATDDPTGFIFGISDDYVGTVWSSLMSILVVTSLFAILLGFTNILGRYIFAMGRAGMLPRAVSVTHHRHQSPHVASVVASITTALVVAGFIISGADPFLELYTWLLALGAVGLLAIVCATSVAVLGFFRSNQSQEGVWQTVIAPAVAAIVFAVAIYLAVSNYNVLTAGSGGVAEWLWLLIPCAAVAGYLVGRVRGLNNLDFSSDSDAPPIVESGQFGTEGLDVFHPPTA
jgi:amino acid transporter